jgi:hypothetical protein
MHRPVPQLAAKGLAAISAADDEPKDLSGLMAIKPSPPPGLEAFAAAQAILDSGSNGENWDPCHANNGSSLMPSEHHMDGEWLAAGAWEALEQEFSQPHLPNFLLNAKAPVFTPAGTWSSLPQHATLDDVGVGIEKLATSHTHPYQDPHQPDSDMPSTLFNATVQQTSMQCNPAEEGEIDTITALHLIGGGSTHQIPLLAFLNSDLNAFRAISRACRENAEDYVSRLRTWEHTGNWNEDDEWES